MSDSSERMQKGIALVGRLLGADAGRTTPMSEEFRRFTIEHLFGEVWQGEGLALEERSLLTCTVLVALARENEQRLHFRGAKNLGIPRRKVEAMIAHVAHYAGWPVAVGAFRVLDEVWPASSE
jgi:4-carboxymuconolactone decarboxylase